ncbi:hypothetical protein Tco_0393673 [Tanacetum coccineum]
MMSYLYLLSTNPDAREVLSRPLRQTTYRRVRKVCLGEGLSGIVGIVFVGDDGVQSFSKDYVLNIDDEAKRALVIWFLPCLILKIAREVVRMMYMHHDLPLVCNLQIIHFDDYGNLLERETDVLVFIEEHARLRHHLSKISHTFRIYLLFVFIVVISSQFATLFQITEFRDIVTFINGGDFAVSSIAQVVGVILCLNAVAKISHSAQGIAALASRWHAFASCGPDDRSNMRFSHSNGKLEAASSLIRSVSSESDMEAMNYVPLPTNAQLTSYLSSYHRRQSFRK